MEIKIKTFELKLNVDHKYNTFTHSYVKSTSLNKWVPQLKNI